MDIPNACLSYLYTLLVGEAVTACHAAGLEPQIGILHADKDRRPSLALDLIEEFRPWVVDQTVVMLGRRGTITPECATPHDDDGGKGIYLSKRVRGQLIDAYEHRMTTSTSGALPGVQGSIRRHLYLQASRLAWALLDSTRSWQGCSWRP